MKKEKILLAVALFLLIVVAGGTFCIGGLWRT